MTTCPSSRARPATGTTERWGEIQTRIDGYNNQISALDQQLIDKEAACQSLLTTFEANAGIPVGADPNLWVPTSEQLNLGNDA